MSETQRAIHPDVLAAINAEMSPAARDALKGLLVGLAAENRLAVQAAFYHGCRVIADEARKAVSGGRSPELVPHLHAATLFLEELLEEVQAEKAPTEAGAK